MDYSLDCKVNSFPGFGQDSTLVVGVWNWAYSSLGANGCVNYTPSSQGYTETIQFSAGGRYRATTSNGRIDSWPYHFEMHPSGWLSLHINTRQKNFYVNADTLIIDSRDLDGPIQIFVRDSG